LIGYKELSKLKLTTPQPSPILVLSTVYPGLNYLSPPFYPSPYTHVSPPQVGYNLASAPQDSTTSIRNVSDVATNNTLPAAKIYDTNKRCWTCGSEQQITLTCPSKDTSTKGVNRQISAANNLNQNNTKECFVKMINCVPKSVVSVETQTMPVMAESEASHSNSVSKYVIQDTKEPIRHRNFCSKIETVSNNSQKHVSVSVD